ncbi:MAG: HAMP domain-containing histidine kinase, partial [Actinomycetota bacterium]|nr:HAMP domain-containing histidine kinase [Actinomycetota bacterium]
AGAVLLDAVLRAGLTGAADERARSQVEEVERLVAEGRLPDVLPAADPSVLVQVLDRSGRVSAATTGTSRAVPLLTPAEVDRAVQADDAVQVSGDRVGYGGGLRVLVRRVAGGAVVFAAVPVAGVHDPLRLVRTALVVGLPLLLLASAWGVWLTVGRTLQPVEQLRSGAEAVTAADPARRLPVPIAEDEVRRLAATLNGMLDRLERGGARQRAFVADAAHELRSPLAAVRTTLEVALLHPDPEGADAALRTALDEVLRMGRLVDDLLLLARLDAGAVRPAQPVDLAEVVRTTTDGVACPARVELDLAQASVRAERDAVVRVVRNLVENGCRHAASVVVVRVVAADPVELLVDDDGPGVPPADRERVFERFVRLDTPRSRDAGGAGLGLALVRELVSALGGTVAAEDAPAGGARLRVRLPRA